MLPLVVAVVYLSRSSKYTGNYVKNDSPGAYFHLTKPSLALWYVLLLTCMIAILIGGDIGKCFHECSPEDSKIDSYVDRRQQMMIAFDISGLLILNTCVLNSISYKLFREFITLLTSNLQSVMPGIQLPTPPPPPPLSPTHEEELDSSRDEDYLSDI
ncbi:Molecular chaperone (DnaJ superfamily) [Abeliophyllum distichum]|uniref:Molecular chaperone (DnaJ superfamily) n=1 Tax=Abeliophyllum distichum TaxID=126358 RepID=A0ABD1QVQ2_9LAMI